MTDDRAKGQWDQAKGSVKETAGRITGDRSTEAEGTADRFKGTIEEKVAEAREAVRDRDR